MDVPVYHAIGAAHAEPVAKCAPRKSGLTQLDLALMGKGVIRRFRLRGRPAETLDVKALMQPGYGR